MKKKVGELYDKPIVIGNPNEVNKDEILLKNTGGGITLSERKDGELENITSSFSPRCFILDTNDIVCSSGFIELAFGHINLAQYSNTNNVIMFPDPNDCIDRDENFCDVDTWVSVNKEHIVAEISYEEFLGNKVDGYFSKIRLIHPGNTNDSMVESPYFLDDFSKQRLNYLLNNPDKAKYNFISLATRSEQRPDYACIKYVLPYGEYIRIGINKTPFTGSIDSILIRPNAEVLK